GDGADHGVFFDDGEMRGGLAAAPAAWRYGPEESVGIARRPRNARVGALGKILRRYQIRLRNSVQLARLDRTAGRSGPEYGGAAAARGEARTCVHVTGRRSERRQPWRGERGKEMNCSIHTDVPAVAFCRSCG